MSDRKAINKYYPPDYDPSKIIKKKKKVKTGTAVFPTVRLMTPFSLKCTSCGEYISKSRKFNARKEVTGETYLEIKIIRFHIRCPRCAAAITFKTDPKSGSFIVDHGAQKNYDSGNTNQILKEETLDQTLDRLEKEEKEEREKLTADSEKRTTLEELEAKVNDLRRQQEMHEELEELREKNKRIDELGTLKETELKNKELIEDEEDDRIANLIFNKKKNELIKIQTNEYSDSDSDSDSDYDQPLTATIAKNTISVKRKPNLLGVGIKRVKR